jgi:hypothetical protein
VFRRNTYLWSVIVVGAIVTTVGGTGIFAVFTDRAGQVLPNTVESGSQPKAVDLQIAVYGEVIGETCGPWQDNLSTPLYSLTNVQPGDSHSRTVCLRNAGSANVSLTASVLDLLGSDPQCTGDEQAVDPACGSPGGGGQLADALQVEFQTKDCLAGVITGTPTTSSLPGLTAIPASVGPAPSLLAATTTCIEIAVRYPSTSPVNTVQAAQSDQVSWRFAFDGTAI